MTGFLMFLHAIICVFLVTIILMQSGRGGGLTEAFSGAESLFGAKTNEFMVKATTIFSVLFLITCLSLAVLSARRDRSLMAGAKLKMDEAKKQEARETPDKGKKTISDQDKKTVTKDVKTIQRSVPAEPPANKTQ